jgi:hypothetical protein
LQKEKTEEEEEANRGQTRNVVHPQYYQTQENETEQCGRMRALALP